MSWWATSCWNFSKLSLSSLRWNRMRKGMPSSVSSWKTAIVFKNDVVHSKISLRMWSWIARRGTNLPVFKGDLPDQRHTLVLSPSVGQVKVGEGAKENHIGDALPSRLVDDVVPADALRLGHWSGRAGHQDEGHITPWRPRWSHCGNKKKRKGGTKNPHPKAAIKTQSSRRMLETFSKVW